ncbi:ALP1-like protein isoform X1 [Tanacetum coccineum]|uniref:ALP1-like protein isoform X1 n=1 Tax=Tanacetum coccineum TaxID=301880 RepID=A0ABQ5FRF9_9ASTR
MMTTLMVYMLVDYHDYGLLGALDLLGLGVPLEGCTLFSFSKVFPIGFFLGRFSKEESQLGYLMLPCLMRLVWIGDFGLPLEHRVWLAGGLAPSHQPSPSFGARHHGWRHGFSLVATSQCTLYEQEAGGSGSAPKRTRTYIPREREEAEQRLLDDYFGDDETLPKYPEENFRRRQRYDACGRLSIGPITSAIRQLAYGHQTHLTIFKKAHFSEKTYELHEEKHGLPGMLGSIDCMHWEWKNCPKSLHCQFKRRDHEYPTIMLEAVADQKLWIWHAYFGVPRANNDLNVLYGSPLFDDEIADRAPEYPVVVNGHTYKKGYYLADGIYPTWATFVKTFSIARDEKTFKFKRVQESSRKDMERAFGVLQDPWGIIRQPARAYEINSLKRIMYCCIMLHNMILEDEGFELNLRDVFVNPQPHMQRTWIKRCDLHFRKTKENRDRKVHNDLRHDLNNH